jgi:hypothetical protein
VRGQEPLRREEVTGLLREVDGAVLASAAAREERLAFWINTYNALVADGIRTLGVRHSVWDVPGFFDRISCRVGDAVFTADEIEHGVLRANRPGPLSASAPFSADDSRRAHAIVPMDPRIHFAISCGARSCPPVRFYDVARLDTQLDAATRAFVNHEMTLEGDALVLSEIFHWFRLDFDDAPSGLHGFLARYLDDGPVRRGLLESEPWRIVYRPYDWRLDVRDKWIAQA